MERRIPQLDAVRGVAILVVMAHNISLKYSVFHSQHIFRNGWMGVDLFFVLSGFLITGILIDTKSSEGYFKNFYVRRCLRIWPLYYSLIFFMFVVIRFVQPSEVPHRRSAISSLVGLSLVPAELHHASINERSRTVRCYLVPGD